MFSEQIDTITAQPEKSNEYPHPIIYRSLINPELYHGRPMPSRASLLEEAIALVIAGTDTTGATMTIGTYHLLRNPEKYQRLKAELKGAWPNISDRPRCEALEKLPYLVSNSPYYRIYQLCRNARMARGVGRKTRFCRFSGLSL